MRGRRRHCSAPFEEATLAKRLRRETFFAQDTCSAEDLDSCVAALDAQATQVSEWLHAMIGLVEPESSMPEPGLPEAER
jgi:hypothetical protein